MQVQDKFYKGVVVDNDDEFRRGRVQVRIEGLHENFPGEGIKWAEVIQPTFMGILGGTGACSVLQIGTGVWIKFDQDYDHPVVVGVLVGGTEQHSGLYDTELPIPNRSGSDWGTEAIPKNSKFRYKHNLLAHNHTNTVHSGKYLTTTTLETPGGHLIELDDTPNTPAIRITHSSGLSQITLNEDGSISITGHTVNVTAAQNMVLESSGDISLRAKENIYLQAKNKDIALNSGKMTGIKAGSKIDLCSTENTHIQSTKGDVAIHVNSGDMIQNISGKLDISCKDSMRLNSDTNAVIQSQNGNITLEKNTSVSSSGGNVILNGNSTNVNTKLDVNGMCSVNGIMQSIYCLAKDMIPCTMPGTATVSLVESYNEQSHRQIDEINAELKASENLDEQSRELARISINSKIREFNSTLIQKKKEIKKSILNDYIRDHVEVFGSVNENEIQLLTESIETPLSITPRSPDGNNKYIKKSECPCDWTDPGSWFEIDGIDEFTPERFKNILSFTITWPDLTQLLPMIPKFSLLAVIQMVMKIVALKIIKLMSIFRKLIMRFIRPVIDMINNTIAIINSIPPKIELNLDLASMIKMPLFEFPELPDSSIPNICCTVNECYCSDCASKVDSWQNTAEQWAKDNIPDNDLSSGANKQISNVNSKLPSGGSRTETIL